METTATVTIASGSGALPSDFLEAISGYTATRGLTYAPDGGFTRELPRRQRDDPLWYTVLGSNALSGASFTLNYYAKIAALSDAATTNWLLTKSPNAYLFGGLYIWRSSPSRRRRGQLPLADADGDGRLAALLNLFNAGRRDGAASLGRGVRCRSFRSADGRLTPTR